MLFLKKPITRFLISIFSLYLLWYLMYELWLHPNQKLDLIIVDTTINASKIILEIFGYSVITDATRTIRIDGTGGLWVGDSCNGIALFALFAGFIIAYTGKAIHKIIYVSVGILLIEFLNILRIVALAILDTHSREWTEFNHTYTFTIVIYGFIFLLWIVWVNKFSNLEKIKTTT